MNDFRLFDVAIGLALTGVFFVLVMLYVREIRYITNTDQIWRMIFYPALILIPFSLLLTRILSAGKVSGLPRIQLFVGVGLAVFIFCPLAGSLYNRSACAQEPINHRAKLIDIQAYSTSIFGKPKGIDFEKEGYHLIIEMEEIGRKTYKMKENIFPDNNPGDSVLVPKKRGCLGITYFYE